MLLICQCLFLIKLVSCLFKVQSVAISPGSDQLIIVRIPGNDLVICLHNEKQENRVAELVGLLSHITKK